MKFRHECKHEIGTADMLALRQRLSAVASADSHSENGRYEIRSLYFDNLYDKALLEKLNGINKREKFRIRLYNGNSDFIRLEKKSKINGLCSKESEPLTKEEAQRLVNGDYDFLAESGKALFAELYSKMKGEGIAPRTIVDYTREAFVFPAGNVRVTLDYNIRTGLDSTDFLNPECVMVPVPDNPIILEVKWDEFLPSVILDIVQLDTTRTTAFSKYAACRYYG